jgi:hypothetical protein
MRVYASAARSSGYVSIIGRKPYNSEKCNVSSESAASTGTDKLERSDLYGVRRRPNYHQFSVRA